MRPRSKWPTWSSTVHILGTLGRETAGRQLRRVAHDFTLEELDIYVYFGPGSEALVDLSAASPGTYPYFCSLHSDGTEGMRGTVTIES
ncbi:MAG: hypothetical protein V3S32_00510 [Acidimicrobiia bacterium]